MKSSDIHIKAISQEIPQPSITKICLKITCLKFHSYFPGANELKQASPWKKGMKISIKKSLQLVPQINNDMNDDNFKEFYSNQNLEFLDNIVLLGLSKDKPALPKTIWYKHHRAEMDSSAIIKKIEYKLYNAF